MPTGDYRITVGARSVENDKELPATDEQGNALGTQPVIGSVRIEKNKNSFLASELWWIEQPLYVDMREMRFLGFALPRNTIHPGALLSVGLYWRARGKPQGDYLVVVQLRDAGGRVVFERASRPAQNTYLTTQWDAGEVLLDWHDLSLPDSIPEGEYQLLVLMRDAGTGQTVGETPIAPVTIHH
jgi:hypothetical protein